MSDTCVICGNSIPIKRQKHHAKSCSDDCYKQMQINRYHKLNPQSNYTNNVSGAISEYRVIIDLLAHGFEVFHTVNPGAPCDLAILKHDKLLRVEVKTLRYNSSGIPFKPNKPIRADVLASVLPDKIIYAPLLY